MAPRSWYHIHVCHVPKPKPPIPQESLLDKFWGKPTPSATRRRPVETAEAAPRVEEEPAEVEAFAAAVDADDRARGKPAVDAAFGADIDLDALD